MKEVAKISKTKQLYKIIVHEKSGKPDYLAIDLYLDIRSRLKKEKTETLKTCYGYLADKYNCSQETIRKKFVTLEKLNLLKRSFTDEYLPSGYHINNKLNLSLDGGVAV